MSDIEPIQFRPRALVPSNRPGGGGGGAGAGAIALVPSARVAFTRQELNAILDVYGRRVAAGEWRDYALDFGREAAVFSIFRRASEVPLFRVEKCPRLARKQGAWSVVAASGLILKRGTDLRRVLAVLDPGLRAVD